LLLILILYLRGAFYYKITYRMKDIPGLEEPHFPLALMGVSASVLTTGYPTDFWFNIDAIYAARLEVVRRARKTIHFETFYMTPGRRADEFADAIAERAEAGVEVLFIADSMGVLSISKDYWKRLRMAGVQVRFFHPFDWKAPFTYNIRTHRKLLLIDGEIAIVGGMGVSDLWDGMEKTGETAPWLDFEVRFIGPIVATLEGIFMQHWLYVGGVATLSSEVFNPTLSGGSPIIVTPSDSPSASSSVCALFYTSVLAAKRRVWIASPYFLPDSNSRKALLKAKKSGVDVRILTVGPHNDKQMIYYAVRERYRDLLKAGIEIYEYHPSMMHAKVLLIDDRWVSTGSANFDPRSLFHNEELHLSLAEPNLVQFAEHFFECAFPKSRRIELAQWQSRPLWQRLLGHIALFVRWQL
jgi:cardiolipin synthase